MRASRRILRGKTLAEFEENDMPKFKVIKTFQYTEVVEVEADTAEAAKAAAMDIDGDRIHDDTLVESVARRIND